MNNYNETIGLRVLNVSPGQHENNVNVNSNITIEFSADINPSSFSNNIVVLEDYNKIFKNINSLKDYSQYRVYKGSISYKDRKLTYTPKEPFNTDTCYIVMLNDGITDITGNRMIKKHISCFYTESIASFPRCEILSPKYGIITSYIPEFLWRNQGSESYVFQVSKSNSFELLLCDEVIPGNKISNTINYTPSFNAKEGMYHCRVKSENGEWSDIHQFFIKPIIDAVVSEEDTSDMIHLEDFLNDLEDPIEVLEYFPPQDSINVNLKTNIIYIKIKGEINKDKVVIEDSYVYGESFDEEHEEYGHEVVDGKWTIVYDSYYDVTYIIFTPVNIDTNEEFEYIETLRSNNLISKNGGENNNENI